MNSHFVGGASEIRTDFVGVSSEGQSVSLSDRTSLPFRKMDFGFSPVDVVYDARPTDCVAYAVSIRVGFGGLALLFLINAKCAFMGSFGLISFTSITEVGETLATGSGSGSSRGLPSGVANFCDHRTRLDEIDRRFLVVVDGGACLDGFALALTFTLRFSLGLT
jgi:hypothetical protein